MSDGATFFRDRLARRWFLYLLIAAAFGGILLLRQQVRRVDASRRAQVVAANSLVHDAPGTLTGGQRYVLEVVGDRTRLAGLTLDNVRVIDMHSRATARLFVAPSARYTRPEGGGRVRQRLGTVTVPQDGDYLVRLDITPPIAVESPDSLFLYPAAGGREFSQSFGMMALGALLFIAILAIGGIVGRSFLDTDAA